MQIVSCQARVPFYYDPSTFQIILRAAIIEEMYKALLQSCNVSPYTITNLWYSSLAVDYSYQIHT